MQNTAKIIECYLEFTSHKQEILIPTSGGEKAPIPLGVMFLNNKPCVLFQVSGHPDRSKPYSFIIYNANEEFYNQELYEYIGSFQYHDGSPLSSKDRSNHIFWKPTR